MTDRSFMPTHRDLADDWQEHLQRHNAQMDESVERAAAKRAQAYAERKQRENRERGQSSVPPPGRR